MPSIAEQMGQFAATLRYEDLSPAVVHRTKRTIMDTLGCAYGGFNSEPAEMALKLARVVHSDQPATMFTGEKTSLDLAAFVNDVMVRFLDFNDGYITKGSGHPSDSIPALVSAGEVAGSSGRDLIVATVVAYEIYCRICDAWANKAAGIDHTTMGAISTAAGAGRLFRQPAAAITEAINITVAGNIALNQTRKGNISKWKNCAYASINRNALFAVQMAELGMTGPAPIFEGVHGFFKIVSREAFELGDLARPANDFGIMRCSTKQFPLGQYSQTVVQASLLARRQIPDPAAIEAIEIRTLQMALNTMADTPDKWRPANHETADHSLPYSAAVALLEGTFEQRFYDEPYLSDPRVRDLIGRIKCVATEEANRRELEMNLCELDVTLKSGNHVTTRVEFHRGHWRNQMTDGELEDKVRLLARDILPESRLEEMFKALWELDQIDVGALVAAMIVPSRRD